jgi:FemAB-related protein (PEP-CTERM system-associated)
MSTIESSAPTTPATPADLHRVCAESSSDVCVRIHKDIDANACCGFSADPLPLENRRLAHQPAWLLVLQSGLNHAPYWLEAHRAGRRVGILPLVHVRGPLFGSFLVSLPYLNSAGVLAEDECAAKALIDRAVELTDELDARYLELRHESRREHPKLTQDLTHKVHMRRELPRTSGELFCQLKPKVRNQVRKAEKQGLTIHWVGSELLADFYGVFSQNMRDLGTPVYSARLFENMLHYFPDAAELCIVRLLGKPVAAAIVVHGDGITDVTSASSLRAYNSTCANMLMYWHLLQRAIEREQQVFDFGRSSYDSNTYAFKKQWGANPEPAVWQYYLRKGSVNSMRPESGRYDLFIRLWKRLPVAFTRLIGPTISRGIP